MKTNTQTSATAPNLLLQKRVKALYAVARSGNWQGIWLALAGEAELAAACSRYAKPSSGWTFLHQAAYVGNEAAARFGRILIGWHGTFDPPSNMDGDSLF